MKNWIGFTLKALMGCALVFMWGPIAVMVIVAFSSNPAPTLPLMAPTLKWFLKSLSDRYMASSLLNSLAISSTATLISVALGLAGAFFIARSKLPLWGFFKNLLIVPILVPGVVLGAFLLVFFKTRLPVPVGYPALIVMHALYGLPFATLIIAARLAALDESLEEAARDLGAGEATVIRTITLPLLRSAVFGGALYVFILSWSDYVRTYMLAGNLRIFTLYMWALVVYDSTPVINAISTILILATVVFLVVVFTKTDIKLEAIVS